jgi:hypothetical protein
LATDTQTGDATAKDIALLSCSLFSSRSLSSGPYHHKPFPDVWAGGCIGNRDWDELRIGTWHGDVQRDECDADEMECDFDYDTCAYRCDDWEPGGDRRWAAKLWGVVHSNSIYLERNVSGQLAGHS